jgi:hypothetical protein
MLCSTILPTPDFGMTPRARCYPATAASTSGYHRSEATTRVFIRLIEPSLSEQARQPNGPERLEKGVGLRSAELVPGPSKLVVVVLFDYSRLT